ncbi:hypothetical protein R1sor_026643 [Riccia sorocarpa]|uniref:DUF4378 domain-containing protein n=1 Tax=Riccia sorocarpa TaxID=122646 RepID=A0ABD3GC11_9MARC
MSRKKALNEPTLSSPLDWHNRSLSAGLVRRPGNLHDVDWNSLLLGKKTLTEQELADVLDAPRNSLESSPGNRTPRFSGVKQEDIPYGVELTKNTMASRYTMSLAELGVPYHGAESSSTRGRRSSGGEVLPIKTLIAQDSSEVEFERKKRSAPSVVARLMGLETLPPGGEKPAAASAGGSSAGGSRPPSNGASRPPKASKSQRRSSPSPPPSMVTSQMHHQSNRGENSNGRAEPPLGDAGFETIKDFPLPRSQPVEPEIVEEKISKFDKLPHRSHPQEKQLQEFKREFMAKLANQRHETPHAAFDREMEEKRRQLREKVCEAKFALLSGGDESRRLSSAQEKLIESKEFQDALELLQSNKEFFIKFFLEPSNSAHSKDPPEPESTSRRSFHLEDFTRDSRRQREFDDSSREGSRKSFHLGDFSRESRKSYLLDDDDNLPKEPGRKSFHLDDLSRESRRLLLHKECPRRSFHSGDHPARDRETKRANFVEDSAKEIRALEDYTDHQPRCNRPHSDQPKRREPSRHKHSSSNGAPKPVAEPKVETLEKDQSWPVEADDGRSVSPTNFDSRKGCHSPSRIVVLKPGPGDITVLCPAMPQSGSPRSYHVVKEGRGGGSGTRDHAREGKVKGNRNESSEWDVHSKEVETRFVKDHRGSAPEGYRDPRAIAKDIVREAKVNTTREISREREIGRRDPPRVVGTDIHPKRSSSRSSVKKIPSPTSRNEVQEQPANSPNYEAVGSFTLAALSRRHSKDEQRSTSPTVPNPSPRIRSQETATTSGSALIQKEYKRRSSEKPTAVYHVDQIEEHFHGARGASSVRKAATQVDINRANFSRPTAFPPSSKPHRIRGDPFLESQLHPDDWKGVDETMYNTLPSSEKILKVEKVESFNSTTGPNGPEGGESPPRCALSRSRSVPNAAILGSKTLDVVGGRSSTGSSPVTSRGFEGVPERMESEHFYLKEKRNEARAAYVLSKRRLSGNGIDSSSTPGRSLDSPWSPTRNTSASSVSSNEERTVVQDVHTVSCQQISFTDSVDHEEQNHLPNLISTGLAEDSLPAEESPRTRSDCEQELLAALAQLTPQVREHTEGGSAVRKPSGHKLHDVQVGKQGTKSTKSWMLSTETLENGDADGASETSVDKCGQPSPVSVLDSPFEAEIPSPVEQKEPTSDLHDLRLRLRLLKLDDSERATALIESLQAKEKLIHQFNQTGVRQTDNCQESSSAEGPNCNVGAATASAKDGSRAAAGSSSSTLPLRSQALHYRLESLSVDGLPCPEGRKGDLLYVRNLLVASGFTESSTMIIARWNSPLHPLDPCLYERLEEYYNDVKSMEKESSKSKASKGAAPNPIISFEPSNRKLLFDVVNEVIFKLLGPRLSYRPWVQPGTPLLRPLPTSKQLLNDIWTEICTCFSPEGLEEFEALDSLMARDVSRGGAWINSREVAEQIALELERAIFDSLIEEAVQCLASPIDVLKGGDGGITAMRFQQASSTYGGPQSWRLH